MAQPLSTISKVTRGVVYDQLQSEKMYSANHNAIGHVLQPGDPISSGTTILAKHSGKIFRVVPGASGILINLPENMGVNGYEFTFVADGSGAGDVTIAQSNAVESVFGVVQNDVTSVLSVAKSTANGAMFVGGTSASGDHIYVKGVGPGLVYMKGTSSVNGGVTIGT